MMHSDFYALSACALSVLYIPFLVIAQLRFAHIMQTEGYSAGRYFLRLRKYFMLCFLPLIGVCAIVGLGRVIMDAYLVNSSLFEMDYMYGFFVVLMVISAAVAVVFYQYVKAVKIESQTTPIVCSNRLIGVFVLSVAFVCLLALMENIMENGSMLVFFVPLTAPLLVPLSNAVMGGQRTARAAA